MRSLLLASAAVASLAFAGAARADVIVYTLGTSNDPATSGAGPFAQLAINRTDATHATFTYTRLGSFWFGEAGGNLNASTFTISNLSFIARPGDSQQPTYTLNIGGQLDGFGNFVIDEVANPAGFAASVGQLSFDVTNTSGSWASVADVLVDNAKGNAAAVHAFNPLNAANGASFFATDSGDPCIGCTPTPFVDAPEPATLAVLATGLLGLGFIRRRRA